MAHEHLATYLNDHLAGAVVALELLGHLERAATDDGLKRFCSELRDEIEPDRQELIGLMDRLGISKSQTRQAAAWITEKLTRVKLAVESGFHGDLRVLEALEALAIGIHGKRALWDGLSAVAEKSPALQGIDYDRLRTRADEQRNRVETQRIEAARAAFRE